MEKVFEARGITKRYRGRAALDNVSITLERGKIYGFVGLNGAGKSTLMRIMGGLVFPDAGEIELFGETSAKGLERARRKTGFLIETPTFYDTMSGRASLNAVRLYKGVGDKGELDRVLARVGLTDPADLKKLVRNYSLGMKQRLGIAAALLGDPELLVLDEPVNGLDPAGVRELRGILKGLADEGKTLLISSHILAELFELATDYIFIHKGKIIEQISLEELGAKCGRTLHVRTENDVRAAQALASMFEDGGMELGDDGIVITSPRHSADEITRLLRPITKVKEVSQSGKSLEEYFLELTGGERDA